MDATLTNRVLRRLSSSGVADEPWALCIVAALDGPAELDAFLDQAATRDMPDVDQGGSDAPRAEPPGVYVTSLTVEGFRGIGETSTLTFRPGPGLTLVVGRNGSGKSSFAEGLEVLMTGNNYRWADRPKVWQEGWKNLHQAKRARLQAELLVEGQGTLTVTRHWNSDRLDQSESAVTQSGRVVQSLDSETWKAPLATFRPFLSYNELGSLLDEGPAKLYDALSSVLGLEALGVVQGTLAGARKTRQARIELAKSRAIEITEAIVALGPDARDTRLAAALDALVWSRLDLRRLEALLVSTESIDTSELALLERLRGLPQPDVEAVLECSKALERAERACAVFAGSSIERSRERAELLDEALRYHEKHAETTCPVCSTPDVLLPSWRERTKAEIASLRDEARAYDAAETIRRERIRDAQRFLNPPPPVMAQASRVGLVSLAEARKLWIAWSAGRDLRTATELASHLADHVAAFAAAIAALVEEATAEWQRRQNIWQPIAIKIAEFLPLARAAQLAKPRITELKSAEEWWKDASNEIRDERFTPIADRAMAIWKQLRLRNNVDLGGIDLEGTAQRRKVTLRVTVDGTPAQALGVMSQGELHALALSLFLPRATLAESPFRFLWIDDPVQSMDPARVEGLARALADTAKTRQVVVFTHDDRLPEAVRRLRIPASMFTVTRRGQSVVEVTPTDDPVTGHLADARTLVRTRELPLNVTARVVPGFCRSAVEAACMEVVRRRRLAKGELHDAVEDLLAANAKPHPLMALALFDDEQRTNDVLPRLDRAQRTFADAFQACKAGAHNAHDGDLDDLVTQSERLARFILKEC